MKLQRSFALWVPSSFLSTILELTLDIDSLTKSNILLIQVLSIQQLYRISTMYWDDKYGTHSVSSDVSFHCLVVEYVHHVNNSQGGIPAV